LEGIVISKKISRSFNSGVKYEDEYCTYLLNKQNCKWFTELNLTNLKCQGGWNY